MNGREHGSAGREILTFTLWGAGGFGTGGGIGGFSTSLGIPLPLCVLVAGALGGAALGLASKEPRRFVVLTVAGALGLAFGVFAALSLGSFFDYSPGPMGALVGAVIGASLGAASGGWRRIIFPAAAGAAGFDVGFLVGSLLRASLPMISGVGSITVAGIVGGASLGAVLGVLASRERLVGQRR